MEQLYIKTQNRSWNHTDKKLKKRQIHLTNSDREGIIAAVQQLLLLDIIVAPSTFFWFAHFWAFGLCTVCTAGPSERDGGLCVQMDFTRTFQTTTKCNNINHVWSHFYKSLVFLKYHIRLWANIFDIDICRSINIPQKQNIPL